MLATGAWGNELLRPLGAEQPIALRRLQVAVLRQPIGAPLPTAVCSDAVTNVVVRPDRGQQFYAVAYFGDEPLERAGDCDNGISDGYEDVVRRAVSERYPRLGGFELQRGFAGPYDSSPDWNPIIGPCPGIEGLYLALAWCGHGFKLSPAVGEVVAAEVAGTHAADRRHRPAPDPVRRGQAAAPRVRPRRARLTVRTAGVILAGGRSRRMGTPKAALRVGADDAARPRLRARRARRSTAR